MVCTDGRFIYLPDVISAATSKAENQDLYRLLAKLEGAHIEFGTHLFDLERLIDLGLKASTVNGPGLDFPASDMQTDLTVFFSLFACPNLADDLFTIFEHGRIWFLLTRFYPGLVRGAGPILEKEAIVLFCEALSVLGDQFAVAGFSGSGRLGVEFYWIKDFSEPLNETVRSRIGAMISLRSTRTGAAIRHATGYLGQRPEKIRLLLTLGDGYPNDIGYKGHQAVADTRKAIGDATARAIFIRSITVNVDAAESLDSPYNSLHHNIISNVRELPDKLWRIYSTLTR